MLQRLVINGERVEYRLDGKSLEDFVTLEALANGIGTLAGDPKDRKRSEAPKLLRRAIALKKAGSSYSEVGLRGDFDPE